MPKYVVHIVNLTFIGATPILTIIRLNFNTHTFFQTAIAFNILLFLLSVPTHNAVTQIHTHAAPRSLVASDYILALLSVVTLVVESTADNQQFAYQTFKHSGGKRDPKVEWPGARFEYTNTDKERGFMTKGLWAWSRHPNFFCEQTFWVRVLASSSLSCIKLLNHMS